MGRDDKASRLHRLSIRGGPHVKTNASPHNSLYASLLRGPSTNLPSAAFGNYADTRMAVGYEASFVGAPGNAARPRRMRVDKPLRDPSIAGVGLALNPDRCLDLD